MGTQIQFARPDGGQTDGYLALSGPGRPGVVVIQEWWGLNDQICGVADRFARAGYNALAPDLYKGKMTTEPDEANHLMTDLDFPDATRQDLTGAVTYHARKKQQSRRDGLLHGRSLDHRGGSTRTRYRCGGMFLRYPASGASPTPPKSAPLSKAISPTGTIGALRPRWTSSKPH